MFFTLLNDRLVSETLFDISQVWVGLATVLPCTHHDDEKKKDKKTQLYLYHLSQFFQTWSQKRACIQDFVQQNHIDLYHEIEQIMNQLDSIFVIYESRFIHLPANMDSQLLSDLLIKDFKNKINI
jgi:hypothetical protein